MKKLTIALVVAFSIGLVARAYATGCAHSAVKVQAVKHVAQYVVPAYGGAYDQPVQQVQQPNNAEVLLQILIELRAIRAALDGAVQPAGMGSGFESIAQAKCAQCHGAEVAQARGAGLTLFDAQGKLVQLSLFEKRMLKRALNHENTNPRRNMPPGGKLTANELAAANAYLQ